MFEIIFKDRETSKVLYAVTDVVTIRHITASEVGFTYRGGRISSCSFPRTEELEIRRIDQT